MMNERVAQAFEDAAEARAQQAEDAFEALNLPTQPLGRYARACSPSEYVFTWEQLVAFALADRDGR